MNNKHPLSPPIRVGIVGLGRAGWNMHFRSLVEIPEFQIVAVADPLEERRREAFERTGCSCHADIDGLLEASDAQVVVVATPSSTHYCDVLKVLEAGRHCIAEKPLSMEFSQAERLVALAKERQLGLFVHHTHLHNPEFHHLKAVIESGILGRIFSIRVAWTRYQRRWDWQTLKKNGGGELNNTGSHALTVLLPLLGEPVVEAFADLRNIKDAGDAEDHVHALLKTVSGPTADLLISSVMALSGPKWLVCGSHGTLSCDGEKSKLRYYDSAQVSELGVIEGAAPERLYMKEDLPWQEEERAVEPAPVPQFHQNVLEVLKGTASAVVTPESAAEVIRVLELIHLAGNQGSVKLP